MVTRRRLLIMDDDPALLLALAECVGHHLIHVLVEVAQTAAAGLHAVTVHRFDAVLCDITMPHMDGFALLHRIQRIAPGTPVILMTGQIEAALEQQAQAQGAWGLIRKPVSRHDLIHMITALLPAEAC